MKMHLNVRNIEKKAIFLFSFLRLLAMDPPIYGWYHFLRKPCSFNNK